MEVGLNPAAFDLRTLVPLLLLIGGIVMMVVIIGALVWLAVAAGGKGASPSGGPTVFDLAWAIHSKLESFDARVEQLESRLLACVDGPKTPGGPANSSGEGF